MASLTNFTNLEHDFGYENGPNFILNEKKVAVFILYQSSLKISICRKHTARWSVGTQGGSPQDSRLPVSNEARNLILMEFVSWGSDKLYSE